MPSASARASRASAISRGGVFQARRCARRQHQLRHEAAPVSSSSSGGPPLWPIRAGSYALSNAPSLLFAAERSKPYASKRAFTELKPAAC